MGFVAHEIYERLWYYSYLTDLGSLKDYVYGLKNLAREQGNLINDDNVWCSV